MLPPVSRNAGRKKPRLLLVDDHRGVLDRAVEMLSGEYDVAAAVQCGRTAVQMALDLHPDAIVLDINMPGFDGFKALSALQQSGSHAPVVFLSMLDGREEIDEAFKRGAHGYVVKSRMGRDLGSALGHVLDGRRFGPSLIALAEQAPHGGHGVHFDAEEDDWVEELTGLFEYAIARGDATCATASAAVCDHLTSRLGGHPRYRAIVAEDALRSFVRDGLPDEHILAGIVAELDQYRITSAGPNARLTVFGNMAGRLVAEGNLEGALALEQTWDRLTKGLPFLTICAYATGCFDRAGAELRQGVCSAHSCVSHPASL